MSTRVIDIDEAIEKIKIALEKEIEGRIFDKNVAEVLELSNASLSKYKERYTLPSNHLINFCIKRNIDLNDFFIAKD